MGEDSEQQIKWLTKQECLKRESNAGQNINRSHKVLQTSIYKTLQPGNKSAVSVDLPGENRSNKMDFPCDERSIHKKNPHCIKRGKNQN